jgi:hypothetical protein
MMEKFMLLIFVPVVWALIAKKIFKESITWREMGLQIAGTCLVIGVVYAVGMYGQTADVEYWNGAVTKKVREHGHYLDPYECMCTTDSDGNRSCSTCYEDRYTVTWYLKSTVGDIRIQHLDRGSKRVYKEPDPGIYASAYVGQPCSVPNTYTNYIQAVPESLFNEEDTMLDEQYVGWIPEYPRLHTIYKLNRALAVNTTVPGLQQYSDRLSEHLKTLGPDKQANIILIFAGTNDPNYRYALERAWLGGKKNDVIVIIGTSQFPKIDWVDTITLGANSGNELMTVKMRDNLTMLGTADNPVAVTDMIAATVAAHFDRKSMEDFKYLEDEIDPPAWVLWFAGIFSVIGSIGMTLYFRRHDPFESDRLARWRRRFRR